MVRGIGGIFIYASNAEALVAWYGKNLGIEFDYEPTEQSYYRDFLLPFDAAFGRTEREVFAIRQAQEQQAGTVRSYIINWRVHNIQQVLAHMQACGTSIERRESYDYGHFAWVTDPEGNTLELFEASQDQSNVSA